MTGGDWTRLLLFTSAVGAVGVLSAWIVAKWFLRRLGRRPAPARTAAGRWSRRGVLSLAGMGVGGKQCTVPSLRSAQMASDETTRSVT